MNSGGSIEMSDEPKTPTEIAAQLWCLPKHANKTMDIELCQDIAKAIHRAQAQAFAQGEASERAKTRVTPQWEKDAIVEADRKGLFDKQGLFMSECPTCLDYHSHNGCSALEEDYFDYLTEAKNCCDRCLRTATQTEYRVAFTHGWKKATLRAINKRAQKETKK